MAKAEQTGGGFEIYSAAGGDGALVQVSDPLHQKILGGLAAGSMSTTDISEMTGKAQSTLSVHLDQMVRQGLIASEYDPGDSRRKIFSLSSAMVACSKEASKEGAEEARAMLAAAVKDPDSFHRGLFRAFVLATEASGLNIGPAMEILGSQTAERLAQRMQSKKVEDIIRHLQEFYERNDLGEVCIYTFLPLTIIIRDAEETQCRFESLAMFSHGLFKTMLSLCIGRRYEIARSEIFGTGNNYYKFVIELAQRRGA